MFNTSKLTSKMPQCILTLYTLLLLSLMVTHTPNSQAYNLPNSAIKTIPVSAQSYEDFRVEWKSPQHFAMRTVPDQRIIDKARGLCATNPYLETDAEIKKRCTFALTGINLWPNFVTA